LAVSPPSITFMDMSAPLSRKSRAQSTIPWLLADIKAVDPSTIHQTAPIEKQLHHLNVTPFTCQKSNLCHPIHPSSSHQRLHTTAFTAVFRSKKSKVT